MRIICKEVTFMNINSMGELHDIWISEFNGKISLTWETDTGWELTALIGDSLTITLNDETTITGTLTDIHNGDNSFTIISEPDAVFHKLQLNDIKFIYRNEDMD